MSPNDINLNIFWISEKNLTIKMSCITFVPIAKVSNPDKLTISNSSYLKDTIKGEH